MKHQADHPEYRERQRRNHEDHQDLQTVYDPRANRMRRVVSMTFDVIVV
jgi:hypothetical protein